MPFDEAGWQLVQTSLCNDDAVQWLANLGRCAHCPTYKKRNFVIVNWWFWCVMLVIMMIIIILIQLSDSAVVNSSPKGKCGRLSQHHCRCSYTMFKACGFVLVGEKNNTQDDVDSAVIYCTKPCPEFTWVLLSESWSAPGGRQLVGQAASLTFESAGKPNIQPLWCIPLWGWYSFSVRVVCAGFAMESSSREFYSFPRWLSIPCTSTRSFISCSSRKLD